MDFTPDPNDRCRIDHEAMIERDDDVWRRRQRGQSFRYIGRALNMPATSVQRCYQRALKRRQLSPIERELEAELDAALAKYGDGPRAEEVSRAEQVGLCNALERYRLRHFGLDSPQRWALGQWAKSHPARSKLRAESKNQ